MEISKKDRQKAIIYLIIAAVLLSTGGVILKFIDMKPMAIVGTRGFISTLVVLAYVKKPKFTFSKPQVIGAICYSFMVIGFVVANKMTTAANAIMLQFTAPIWVSILGMFFLKEKIKVYDIVSIIVVSCGMILFFIDDFGNSAGNMAGNMIAILSGVALAGTTIALRLQKHGNPVETTLMGHMITFLIGLPFMFGAEFNLQNIIGLLLLGVFQLGISYILYSLATKYLSALEVILIMFLEPILNPIWVILFYNEVPSILALIGGAIVVTTIFLRSVIANKYMEKEVIN